MALDVDAIVVSGAWWRHIPHRGRVYHRPDPPADGRWQHGATIEGFYLANDPATAWAEWYRALAELGIPPMRQMPRNLWRWGVSLEVANLSDAKYLARVGLAPPPPGRRSWPPYQHIGDQLWQESWAGVLAPSAARPRQGATLCIFRATDAVSGAHPVPPPRVHRLPPVVPTGLRT